MAVVLDLTQLLPEQRRPITRDEYHRMGEAGLFEGERVELIQGVIVRMTPRSELHDGCLERLNELLMPRLVGRARLRVQLGYAASEYSEPEPDLAILSRNEPRGEQPGHALLMIEVANTSLRFDRKQKAAVYAENGVPEYWVIDVVAERVEVFTQPTAESYAQSSAYVRGDSIPLGAFPDVVVAVDDLFA